MIRNSIIGLIVGYILTNFNFHIEVINFIQPFVTFEVTMLVYYIICATAYKAVIRIRGAILI